MFQLADVLEQSFEKLQDLRDLIAGQDRGIYEVPMSKVSLGEDGILRAGAFKGRLTKPALVGLLNTEGIPLAFVLYHCPADLLVTMVRRLAQEQQGSIVVQTTDGVATGIMPADRQPITHDMLVDRLGVDRPIKEATYSADCLRITATTRGSKELLPNDTFGFGWELITSENGWRPTEAWRWVVREVCSNGAVGFDKDPVFKRSYNSREPTLVSMQKLLDVLENDIRPPELKSTIKWAANKRIGRDREPVISYLARRLQGDPTKMEFDGMGISTTWYDLMNRVTSLARLYSLELRRRYEVEGGILLNWFLRQGRSRPPWRRMSCDECEVWNVSKLSGQDAVVETNSPSSLSV